jgi:hypothetical protein
VLVNMEEQSAVVAEVRTVVDPPSVIRAVAAEDGQRGFRRHAARGAGAYFWVEP